MKKIVSKLMILLFLSGFCYAQDQIGYIAGDTNSVAGIEKDRIHSLLSVSGLGKLFTDSYNFSIYAPSDTLWVRIGSDTNSTAGRMLLVLPGVPLTVNNIRVDFNEYISIIGFSATASRKKYIWGLGGI